MTNPFIDALRAAFRRLAQEDVDIRADLTAAIAEAGMKQYANMAAVDAVTTAEVGLVFLPAGTDWFGDGFTTFYAGQAIIESTLADGAYGQGLPPAGSGMLTQVARWTDGYGQITQWVRTRFYDASVPGWAAPSAWVRIPVPNFRPSQDAFWYASATQQGYRQMVTPSSPADHHHGLGNSEQYVASYGSVFMANMDASFVESGRLNVRSASAVFDGILDGAATDYGTRAFVARSNSVMARTGRLEWTAAASAAGAVAGVSIPFPTGGRPQVAGWGLHATFGLTGGVTADTRVLCGVVATAQLATAMSDVDPASINDFIAVGFGTADATFGVFGEGTSRVAQAALEQVPAANELTRVDVRIYPTNPNGTLYRVILTIRRNQALTRTESFLVSIGGLPQADLAFFLRMSAGATAAQPKVSLYRLRLGVGMFNHG